MMILLLLVFIFTPVHCRWFSFISSDIKSIYSFYRMKRTFSTTTMMSHKKSRLHPWNSAEMVRNIAIRNFLSLPIGLPSSFSCSVFLESLQIGWTARMPFGWYTHSSVFSWGGVSLKLPLKFELSLAISIWPAHWNVFFFACMNKVTREIWLFLHSSISVRLVTDCCLKTTIINIHACGRPC